MPEKKPSKTVLLRRLKVEAILPILRKTYPDARCSLDFTTPLELVVATSLSAQCTDVRVNMVTKWLFAKYKSAADYANADQAELERDIQSTGFYRNKAKNLIAMGKTLCEQFGGEVPRSMDQLTTLAGVGRKTANVVLGNAFNTSVGVTVDTHVTRVANRLGLTKHPSDAIKIEQDLIATVPPDAWCEISHLLIYHGRQICDARKPKCEICPLFEHCPTGPKVLKERMKDEG